MVQELHRIVERILYDGSRKKSLGHSRTSEPPPGDGVLTVHTLIDAKGELQDDENYVDVFSPYLQSFLTDILKDYPNAFEKTEAMRFEHPFYSLIHRHQQIRDFAKSATGSDREMMHLKKLLTFLDTSLEPQIKQFNLMQVTTTAVSFDHLWTCFEPGGVVVKVDEAHFEECWEINNIFYARSSSPEYSTFNMTVRQLQYVQKELGFSQMENFPLPHFSGTRNIHGLDFVPLKRRRDWETFRKAKIADGHRWWEMLAHDKYHALYNTIAFTDDKLLFPQEDVSSNRNWSWRVDDYKEKVAVFKPIHVMGEIIVDPPAYVEANPQHSVFLDTAVSVDEMRLTDEQALLAPARVQGFSLSLKIWALFQVAHVKGMDWESNRTYEKLEIGEDMKSLLTNLITSQSKAMKETDRDPLLAQGGAGLVFLLHGSPGTGKTLTAQAMASYIRQPLYSTTSGEINKHGQLEVNLRNALRWSRRWRAVFLLDEADAFLAKRDISREIARNEMVTIFLQQVEGFSGIMFFSTNHTPEGFDEAFLSRIHATLWYKALTGDQKFKIWKHHCSERGITLDSQDVWELVKRSEGLSGRDIRNVVQMAVLLRDAPGWNMGVETMSRLIRFRGQGLDDTGSSQQTSADGGQGVILDVGITQSNAQD